MVRELTKKTDDYSIEFMRRDVVDVIIGLDLHMKNTHGTIMKMNGERASNT